MSSGSRAARLTSRNDAVDPVRLARRIETEAWAYEKADSTTKDIRWGRVLGFLEVGTHAGY